MSQIGALFSGLFGDAGKSFVGEQGGPDKVFGTKPQVADFVPVDLGTEAGKAIDANQKNLGGITDFLNKVIPGFSDLLTQGTSNALSELQGNLPQDVIDQIQRSTAFQSLVGGYAGTGMSKALTARDLGISSLNLTQTGQNSAQAWAQLAEQAYSPFTISTSEQAGTTAQNNAGIQANQQLKFNVAAAPDPGAAGIFNVDAALGQQMLAIGGSFLGGGGGGGATAAVGGSNNLVGAGGAGVAAGNNNLIGGGANGSAAYQYNPSTGQFSAVPVAQGAWG